MFKLVKLIEKGFVVFSLLIFSGALLPVVSQIKGLKPEEPEPIKQIIFLGIRVGIIFLAAIWYKKVFITISREKFLWLVVAVAFFSVFWSEVPNETLRSTIVLVLSTLFGVYLAARYSLKEQIQLLAWALGIGALLSLTFAVALPSYGVMGMADILTSQDMFHTGAWKGVYVNKNALGRLMSLGSVVFLLLAKSSQKNRWVAWTGLVFCVGLVLCSTSKTALIVFLTIASLIPLFRTLRWNHTFALPFFIALALVGGAVAILFFSNAETILGTFGRDITLTGRTLLWTAVFYKISQHLLLGYGYGAFWLGWEGESADVMRIVQWETPHAHNGLLDLWLDLGLLGLLVFTISFLTVCLQAIVWVRQTKDIENLWPLVYLTFLFLANLTESSLLRHPLLWVLYVATTLSINSKNRIVNAKVSKVRMSQATS